MTLDLPVTGASGPRARGRPSCSPTPGPLPGFRSARTREVLPGHMARLELLPLSIAELRDSPLNLIDHLLAGDFRPADPRPSSTRKQIARRILLGGYPEVQNMSPRARTVWFRSYTEGRFFKDGRIVGVKVKASATAGQRDFDGLAALAELAGPAFERGVLLYTGQHALAFHRGPTRFHALPLGVLTDPSP